MPALAAMAGEAVVSRQPRRDSLPPPARRRPVSERPTMEGPPLAAPEPQMLDGIPAGRSLVLGTPEAPSDEEIELAFGALRDIDTSGKLLLIWGQQGTEPGRLSYPYDLEFDREGNLFVIEFGNHRVQRFTPAGESLGCWGQEGRGEGERSARIRARP